MNRFKELGLILGCLALCIWALFNHYDKQTNESPLLALAEKKMYNK